MKVSIKHLFASLALLRFFLDGVFANTWLLFEKLVGITINFFHILSELLCSFKQPKLASPLGAQVFCLFDEFLVGIHLEYLDQISYVCDPLLRTLQKVDTVLSSESNLQVIDGLIKLISEFLYLRHNILAYFQEMGVLLIQKCLLCMGFTVLQVLVQVPKQLLDIFADFSCFVLVGFYLLQECEFLLMLIWVE